MLDKHMFVATKMIPVAAPASENREAVSHQGGLCLG